MTPHKIGEEELASTLSSLGLTRGSACPCVWRGRIKGEDIVATVHGDDITIGGQGSAVESLIKMISKKYEIKKQVLGVEKSGRILNRVIEWDHDGIIIEADQRHVREIMKGLELERANHSATPCDVERRDESKGENRCGRGQTKYRWNDMNDDDERDRPGWSMTMPLTVRHLQVVTSHDIEHSLLESVTCHKTAQTSSSQQCRYAVRWPTPQCVSRGSEDTSLADREQSAGSAGSKVVNWRRIQTRTGEATRPLGDQSQAGSSREAATVSRCGPRSSKRYHCLPPRVSCTPQSKPHQKGLGSRAWQRTWAYCVG